MARLLLLIATAEGTLVFTGDTSIPSLDVPACDDGLGQIVEYFVTKSVDHEKPIFPTTTSVCWNSTGIVISTNNTDDDIWQTCKECGCANYEHGNVAEVFISPVSSPDKDPSWYYELDVGAVTGAFWGAIVHNSLGNDTVYPSLFNCSAAPQPGAFAACELKCNDTLPSVEVETGSSWWSRTMVVPWTLFQKEYVPQGSHGAPWEHWRANFYRYAYPFKLENGSWDHAKPELSGWSPTRPDGGFHAPTRFGRLVFKAAKSQTIITSFAQVDGADADDGAEEEEDEMHSFVSEGGYETNDDDDDDDDHEDHRGDDDEGDYAGEGSDTEDSIDALLKDTMMRRGY